MNSGETAGRGRIGQTRGLRLAEVPEGGNVLNQFAKDHIGAVFTDVRARSARAKIEARGRCVLIVGVFVAQNELARRDDRLSLIGDAETARDVDRGNVVAEAEMLARVVHVGLGTFGGDHGRADCYPLVFQVRRQGVESMREFRVAHQDQIGLLFQIDGLRRVAVHRETRSDAAPLPEFRAVGSRVSQRAGTVILRHSTLKLGRERLKRLVGKPHRGQADERKGEIDRRSFSVLAIMRDLRCVYLARGFTEQGAGIGGDRRRRVAGVAAADTRQAQKQIFGMAQMSVTRQGDGLNVAQFERFGEGGLPFAVG